MRQVQSLAAGGCEHQLDTVVTAATSRLSCQIIWTPELDGLELTLAPAGG